MHDLMMPHVMAVTLGLVDDGELLVYPLSISGSLAALLCSGSQVDDPYLIYGDDDHLVSLVSKFYY
jgi:hypothetical protein